jgi:hypothetical protein
VCRIAISTGTLAQRVPALAGSNGVVEFSGGAPNLADLQEHGSDQPLASWHELGRERHLGMSAKSRLPLSTISEQIVPERNSPAPIGCVERGSNCFVTATSDFSARCVPDGAATQNCRSNLRRALPDRDAETGQIIPVPERELRPQAVSTTGIRVDLSRAIF